MIINGVYSVGGGYKLSLAVSVASGSVVTATLGSKSVSGTAVDGVCVLTLPEAGTWTVQATLGGRTTEAQTVTVPLGMALEYGTPLGEMAVGSSVYLNLSGVRTEFLVVNQGKPGSMYDDSCDGTWLLTKNIYENRAWHSSDNNDYANSDIHSYLNGDFLALFDADIRNAIKQVKIPYRVGSGIDTTVTSGANGLSAKIFLLSATEVNFGYDYAPTNEGACLSCFSGTAQNSGDTKRVAYWDGSAQYWWLRSPYCSGSTRSTYALLVSESGNLVYPPSNGNRYPWGVRPAMVLPSSLYVTEDGTISA